MGEKRPVNTATLWRNALERLDTTPIDAVTQNWLQDAHLIKPPLVSPDESGALMLILQVPNEQACDVIQTRWHAVLENLLKDVHGKVVALEINYTPDPPLNTLEESVAFPQGRETYERSTAAGYHNSSYYDIAPILF